MNIHEVKFYVKLPSRKPQQVIGISGGEGISYSHDLGDE
jgi:hypothetical protein